MRIALSVSDREWAKGRESKYFRALVAAGARPEEIQLLTPEEGAHVRAEDYDGIVFAGGEDVDPALYGEAKRYDNVTVNRRRDDFEHRFLDRALAHGVPILGICRGSQMINVKFGGTLYQDLPQDLPGCLNHRQTGSRSDLTHRITLTEPQSWLAQAVQGSCPVNSLHHQAIRRLGRGLKVTAHSEDGLVEAIEAAGDYPFLLAVQWHPEELTHRPEQLRIFELFLARCREAARLRGAASGQELGVGRQGGEGA
jgi:putative glutamine amidotransferase